MSAIRKPLMPLWCLQAGSALKLLIEMSIYCLVMVGWFQQVGHGLATALLAVVGFAFAAAAVQGIGRVVTARLQGMAIWYFRIWPFEFEPHRRGVRWRTTFNKGGDDIVVITPPDRSRRKAYMWLAASAPLSHAVACIVADAAGDLLGVGIAAQWLHAFAILNVGLALAELVPAYWPNYSGMLSLLAWYRRGECSSSERANDRLVWLSYTGTTADRIPPELLQELEQQGTMMRLIALWTRMKAAQNLGDWAKTADLEQARAALTASFGSADTMAGAARLDAQLKLELEFSRSMQHRDAAAVPNVVDADLLWYAPHLQPRLQALRSALQGDAAGMEAGLAAAQRLAYKSRNLALHESEDRIADHVRAVLLRPASLTAD